MAKATKIKPDKVQILAITAALAGLQRAQAEYNEILTLVGLDPGKQYDFDGEYFVEKPSEG